MSDWFFSLHNAPFGDLRLLFRKSASELLAALFLSFEKEFNHVGRYTEAKRSHQDW